MVDAIDLPPNEVYCGNCGTLISRGSNFCIQCGTRVMPVSAAAMLGEPATLLTITPAINTTYKPSDSSVLRDSKAGIVSGVIACVSFINWIVITGGCMANWDEGYNPDAFKVLSIFHKIGMVLLVIGFISGIIGITESNCKKSFAVLGLIFNTIMLLYAFVTIPIFM